MLSVPGFADHPGLCWRRPAPRASRKCPSLINTAINRGVNEESESQYPARGTYQLSVRGPHPMPSLLCLIAMVNVTSVNLCSDWFANPRKSILTMGRSM